MVSGHQISYQTAIFLFSYMYVYSGHFELSHDLITSGISQNHCLYVKSKQNSQNYMAFYSYLGVAEIVQLNNYLPWVEIIMFD